MFIWLVHFATIRERMIHMCEMMGIDIKVSLGIAYFGGHDSDGVSDLYKVLYYGLAGVPVAYIRVLSLLNCTWFN